MKLENNKINTLTATDLEELKFTDQENKQYWLFTQLIFNNTNM